MDSSITTGTVKPRFDFTINLGTVIHLCGLLGALVAMMVTLSAWKSATEARLASLEDRMARLEVASQQTHELLWLQNERLSRIEGKMDKADGK